MAQLNRSFTDVAAYDEISLNLGAADEPRRVEAEMVSASYFGILGICAARGRTFPRRRTACLTRGPSRSSATRSGRRVRADPGLSDGPITLNDRPFTIVGVMSEGFRVSGSTPTSGCR